MTTTQHITLHKLQTIIKSRLEDAMPMAVWVTAEISELKVNYSGHCYMELVEKGGDNQVPKAKASAVIWRSQFGLVGHYFRSTTGSDLAEGMNVLLKVKVGYHELYGMSLVISDIDPLYTLGDMEQQRRQTIAKLQEEGVFDMNRSLEMPPVVQRVAVVSSRNAAGYQDFMNELDGSGYAFSVTLFDAFMQGAAAEESVIGALERVLEAMENFDVVVMIRGGGSQSDLAAFDSYRLCSHIAQFPLPVVVGIGHDKDQSVADLVAALSLKTPTAVATYLVAELATFDGWLVELMDGISTAAKRVVDEQTRLLEATSYLLSKAVSDLSHELNMQLGWLSSETLRISDRIMMLNNSRLDSLSSMLGERVRVRLQRESARFMAAEGELKGRDIESILSLGFAVVRSGGRVIKQGRQVGVGESVEITLSSGKIGAKVEKIEI